MAVRLIADSYLVGLRNRLISEGVKGLDADCIVTAIGLANRAAWRYEKHGRVDLVEADVKHSLAFPDLGARPAEMESPLYRILWFAQDHCKTDGEMDFMPTSVKDSLREWARRDRWQQEARAKSRE